MAYFSLQKTSLQGARHRNILFVGTAHIANSAVRLCMLGFLPDESNLSYEISLKEGRTSTSRRRAANGTRGEQRVFVSLCSGAPCGQGPHPETLCSVLDSVGVKLGRQGAVPALAPPPPTVKTTDFTHLTRGCFLFAKQP